jgi:uncharacterized protein
MPEYLAPGVYVEEVPSTNKPIEGVSTSTAGFVGVTQRGPVNDPTLVTSFAEFSRTFGDHLDHRVFTRDRDKLPYAVDGFFANGGQRVYVSRIVGEQATFAAVDLYGEPAGAAAATRLVDRADAGATELVLEDADGITDGTILLVVDGPRAEYVRVAGEPEPAGVLLSTPLQAAHAAGDAVVAQDVQEGQDLPVSGDMAAGAAVLALADPTGLTAGAVLRVQDDEDAGVTEYVTVAADGEAAIEQELQFPHPRSRTRVHVVTLTDAAGDPGRTLTADAAAGRRDLRVGETGGLPGELLRIGDGDDRELRVVAGVLATVGLATSRIAFRLRARLRFDHDGDEVAVVESTEDQQLTVNGAMATGARVLAVDEVASLTAGGVVRIRDTGDPSRTEFVTVTADGQAEIEEPLLFDHPQASTQVHRVTLAPAPGEPGGRTVQGGVGAGAGVVPVTALGGLEVDHVVRIGTGNTAEFQIIRHLIDVPEGPVGALRTIHAAGVGLVAQVALLRVRARYQGNWGNRVRVRTRQSSVLQTQVAADADAGDSPVRLNASFGLAPGSVLEFVTDTASFRQRVATVSSGTNEVALGEGLAAAVRAGAVVRSVEFDLIAERLDERGRVAETETVADLGLNVGHNRYVLDTVGRFDADAGRGARSGESELVRLEDLTAADDTRLLSVPFANVPDGAPSPRDLDDLYLMAGGSDDLTTIDDAEYIGTAAVDPDDRTGIQSLENVDEISLVAVPGQAGLDVQNALVAHCAKMRFRFAVLDSGDRQKVRAVQEQRQNHDTTYAALYYPWLHVRDPFGQPGEQLAVPPSGHVTGIYARSDTTRGVHKAPANEVVLGIRELQVRLTKGEQDILNPRHVNCLRDFRDMNRGLRVWGARTLSSDPEWKYVNVRRLFLFVEKSIERGSQYAVFEPNSESLWATVNRSVTGFLTAVWRSGALEGTKVEEAFFVKVDRTTMTQNDIDNGRLIILIGIAPVKPAEFVVFRVSQKTREAVA